MKYIYQDESGVTHFAKYFEYLARIKDKFPKPLYQFVGDPSRYALNDPKTMHDSWVVSVFIREDEHGPDKSRLVSIDMRLLGPYHDRYFELMYQHVRTYEFDCPEKPTSPHSGHGDLLYQEFRLTEDAKLCHEIQFSSGRRFYVECDVISVQEVGVNVH